MKNARWYFICFFTCIFFSCKYKENKKQAELSVTKFRRDSIRFSPIDSLNFYGMKYDSVNQEIDSFKASLYINNINGVRTAILCFTDSAIIAYKKSSEGWIETSRDSFYYRIAGVREIDLNGDDLKDIIIMYPVMRGNIICEVFLFDKLSQSFKHNSYFDLINIGFDPKTGFIRSCALGGNFDNSKSLYRITGDSLTFYKRVEEEINDMEKYGSSLKLYENIKGIKTLTKTVKGSWDDIPARFDTTLWKDGLDYFHSVD